MDTCTYVGERGPCGQTVGLLAGVGGKLLCAWHDPARVGGRREAASEPAAPAVQGQAFPTAADLPVQSVESLEDAEKLARWAVVAVATGRLDPRRAQSLVALVKEYRMVQADGGVLRRAAELVARAERDAAEFADLRRRVAAAKARGVEV